MIEIIRKMMTYKKTFLAAAERNNCFAGLGKFFV
jgi:hypothetical protein